MKLSLARLPTPIEFLSRLSQRYDREFFIKRDDMTEFVSSGNKIRKLEFLLADALRKGCKVVFTCGGIQSNHARATAHLAVRLGLKPVLFLRESKPTVVTGQALSQKCETGERQIPNGNLLIDKLLGAELVTVSVEEYARIEEVYEEHRERFEKDGMKVYTIPEGGSNSLGAMGYVMAAAEISSQINLKEIDAIYCAVGSGGTYAGLLAGLRYIGYGLPVVGINVTKSSSEKFIQKILEIIDGLKEFGIDLSIKREDVKIVDDFSGPAYAVPTESDLECIKDLASSEGVLLDPVYTAKAFRGMLETSKRGQKVLFIHTGGLFGLFAQADRFAQL